ncbi:MAG: RNA-protein complex protein Nop10 [Candidatus Bathyarchaeia archaeon]
MRWQIRRCPRCRNYTLKDICPNCDVETETPIPAKFSPQDKYARYRVQRWSRRGDDDSRGSDEAE